MTLRSGQPAEFLDRSLGARRPAGGASPHTTATSHRQPRPGTRERCWRRCGCGPPTGQSVLLLAAHVLAMDPASWQVVLGELDAALHALVAGKTPAPVREHTSYRRWVARD